MAIAEIIFYLLKNNSPEKITEDIATCLLAGIIQKTKNFKTSNLTPRTLLTTSQLISDGANREEIVDHLYRSRSLATLKLWGRVLNNLHSEQGEEIIWSKLNSKDLQETTPSIESLDEIIDELIMNVPNARLAIIFCEETPATSKIIIYSLKNANALELLNGHSPKGTAKLAIADIQKDIETASIELITEIKNKLEKLSA